MTRPRAWRGEPASLLQGDSIVFGTITRDFSFHRVPTISLAAVSF
jgi:hypothetical protein